MSRAEPVAAARRTPGLGLEVALVLGVSLGESALYAVLRIVERMTRDQPLSQQTSQLNTSTTPDRPWLDLAYQLANIALPLVPVALAVYLLAIRPGVAAWAGDDPAQPALRRLGLDVRLGDLWRGLAVAAGIGIPGLGFYLLARELGINTTVQAGNLAQNWWTVPVYLLSAGMNGLLEESLMLGYVFLRLRQLRGAVGAWVSGWRGWWWILLGSAVVRGAYHLYQGWGGFAGNLVMGLAFGLLFLRWKRAMPLVVAHTLLDVVAFVGYAYLAGRVTWL